MLGILVIYRIWNIWLAIFVLVMYRRGSKGGSSSSSGGGLFATRSLGTNILSRLHKIYVIGYIIAHHFGGVFDWWSYLFTTWTRESLMFFWSCARATFYCHLIIDNCLKASPLLQAFQRIDKTEWIRYNEPLWQGTAKSYHGSVLVPTDTGTARYSGTSPCSRMSRVSLWLAWFQD